MYWDQNGAWSLLHQIPKMFIPYVGYVMSMFHIFNIVLPTVTLFRVSIQVTISPSVFLT